MREPLERRMLVRGLLLGGALAAAVVGFVALLRMVAHGGTDGLDSAVLAAIAERRTTMLTDLAVDVTALGSRVALTIGALLASGVLWASGRRLAAVDTGLACASAALVTQYTKGLLARPRPAIAAPLVHAGGFSFPSGHSSGITALVAVIALHTIESARTRRQRAVLVYLYVSLIAGVGWSRVYLGVHYPSDVAAGLCVGVACALGAHAALRTRTIVRWLRTVRAA